VRFRSRFGDLVRRQLDLFEEEHRGDLEEVHERLELYNAGDRDDAEELYGDYLDALETGTEILADMRDHYAASLTEQVAERYLRDFDRAVAKRLPAFRLELENR